MPALAGLGRDDYGVSGRLPSGTVTFLFSDIEGSTRLLHELGDRYVDALAEHRRLLRQAFTRHGGVEVGTEGDSFFVAFADARAAVSAAAEAQSLLGDGPVRVRMGLHTGEPIVWAEGYAGLDVHRAARICAAAHGGQIVLSQRTRELCDGVGLHELGLHRLKDLSEPQPLYQFGDGVFPPLRTLHATNLPIQPTALVGRERELARAGALLREHRLVTLTGAGGAGKTRLALQLAADALEDFPQGVFWVSLQAVEDADLVMPTIAQVLGATDRLADFVADKRLLLLLDNLEQVVDAAPALAELVSQTASAKLLVTSREPLRVAGEHRYAVEPLRQSDAVTLFLERGRAIDPGLEPTPAVSEICRRLDGLPLAIELAAARLALLSPGELLARLERALPLLTAGARGAPARQRTLRATIDWSHGLLDQDEQSLFRRLAVFASFTLDAVESVCDATLDTLQSLVDMSLVRRWGSGRLGMLETVHEYAEERLAESGDADAVRRRHAEYCLAFAESANLAHDSVGEQLHELVQPEQANFRRALAWAVERTEVELGLRLVYALELFWYARDPFEGRRWLEALLAVGGELSPEERARALLVQGGLIFLAGEFERGTALFHQSLALYRQLEDEAETAQVLDRLAHSALAAGDYPRAIALAQESLELHRRAGSRWGEVAALSARSEAEWHAGDRSLAFQLMREGAAAAGESHFDWWQANCLGSLSEWSTELGRLDEAERYGLQALEIGHRVGYRISTVYLLALLARIAGETGRLERAGLLWGALEAEEERAVVGQWEAERDAYAASVLAHAGPEFERGRQTGRSLPLDSAIDEALKGA